MKKVALFTLAAATIAAASVPATAQDQSRNSARTSCANSADERQRGGGPVWFYVGSDELLPWGKTERCPQPARRGPPQKGSASSR